MPNKFGDDPVVTDQPRSKFGDLPVLDQPTTPVPPAEKGFGGQVADFGSALWNGVKAMDPRPLVKDVMDRGLPTVAAEMFNKAGDAANQEWSQAGEHLRQGDPLGVLTHTAGALVPVIGPAINAAGTRISKGEVGGGLGDYAVAISPMVGPMAARGIARAIGLPGPRLAESAVGINRADRAFGATPGKAILEDTSGFRPATIARTGQESLGQLMPQLEATVSASNTPVDLAPLRQTVAEAQALAVRQGNLAMRDQLQPMADALAGNRAAGTPYTPQVSPSEALDLRRGWGEEFATYNPNVHDRVNAVAKKVYTQLNEQIHEAAPGSAEIDQRIHSLIPAVRKAESASRGPSIGERLLARFDRPTGALLGGYAGYQMGGVPGAAAAIGAQEVLASPVARAAAARGLYGLQGLIGSEPSQGMFAAGPLALRFKNQPK